MTRVVLCVLAAFAATVVAARVAFNATAGHGSESANQPWAQHKMEFVAWNDERWTAWIRDDAFEQLPQNNKRWARHANPSIAFIDWEGSPWQAKIDGDEFLLAHRGDWNGTTQRTTAIRYRDWAGGNEVRTVDQLRR